MPETPSITSSEIGALWMTYSKAIVKATFDFHERYI